MYVDAANIIYAANHYVRYTDWVLVETTKTEHHAKYVLHENLRIGGKFARTIRSMGPYQAFTTVETSVEMILHKDRIGQVVPMSRVPYDRK
jgi:hypothetical protein